MIDNDLKEIFSAIEQINLLSEERKKKRINLKDNLKEEKVLKLGALKNHENIPSNTEELIKQAEKQLSLINKNKKSVY